MTAGKINSKLTVVREYGDLEDWHTRAQIKQAIFETTKRTERASSKTTEIMTPCTEPLEVKHFVRQELSLREKQIPKRWLNIEAPDCLTLHTACFMNGNSKTTNNFQHLLVLLNCDYCLIS